MGQLDTYTLQDIYLVSIISGVLATYFAEEIEATIESVVAYTYSTNLAAAASRKRCKVYTHSLPAGDIMGAMHLSINFFLLVEVNFIEIANSLSDRTIWQDQDLIKRYNLMAEELEKLKEKYND